MKIKGHSFGGVNISVTGMEIIPTTERKRHRVYKKSRLYFFF